jgi:hypothetical protein
MRTFYNGPVPGWQQFIRNKMPAAAVAAHAAAMENLKARDARAADDAAGDLVRKAEELAARNARRAEPGAAPANSLRAASDRLAGIERTLASPMG